MKTTSRTDPRWKTPLTLAALSVLVRQYKNLGTDLAKIQATIYYLRGVKKVRQFLLYLFQILFSAFMLVVGIVLVEVAAVFWLPLNPQQQVLLVLGFGIFDLFIAVGMIFYLFSGKRWLRGALKQNKNIEKWFHETWHEY